jgi:hypothetical protein
VTPVQPRTLLLWLMGPILFLAGWLWVVFSGFLWISVETLPRTAVEPLLFWGAAIAAVVLVGSILMTAGAVLGQLRGVTLPAAVVLARAGPFTVWLLFLVLGFAGGVHGTPSDAPAVGLIIIFTSVVVGIWLLLQKGRPALTDMTSFVEIGATVALAVTNLALLVLMMAVLALPVANYMRGACVLERECLEQVLFLFYWGVAIFVTEAIISFIKDTIEIAKSW